MKKHNTELEKLEYSPSDACSAHNIFGNDAKPAQFGPELPNHLAHRYTSTECGQRVIGPTLPSGIILTTNHSLNGTLSAREVIEQDENPIYGPLPATGCVEMTKPQLELEERKLKLKLLSMYPDVSNNQQIKREEWMIELPEVRKQCSLSLSIAKRSFYQGKDRSDFTDRSIWTKIDGDDTPSSSQIENTESLCNNTKAIFDRERDKQQERIAKKHRKLHKKQMSLLEQHKKNMAREQKQKTSSGVKKERRPFSRELDMKVDKTDRDHIKRIVDRAKVLDTKFGNSSKKYL